MFVCVDLMIKYWSSRNRCSERLLRKRLRLVVLEILSELSEQSMQEMKSSMSCSVRSTNKNTAHVSGIFTGEIICREILLI